MVKKRLNEMEALNFEQIIADKLLSLHNESWNESEKDTTHETFRKEIALDSITLDLEGQSMV